MKSQTLSLALQGGGSFGAITAGVLTRLLDVPDLEFDTVSGTSAGAVNAVLLADGLAQGGRISAQQKLQSFWSRLANSAPALGIGFSFATSWMSGWDLNPLRNLLESEIDFERLRAVKPLRLILNATRVRDGHPHYFREHDVTIDVVMASACLPNLASPVEIDGEFYWDGGYTANPPLQPLALASRASDILLVQILPEDQSSIPRTPLEIAARTAMLAFNSGLQRELAALDDLSQLARERRFFRSPRAQKLAQLRLHRIKATDYIDDLHRENPLFLDPRFLNRLREAGTSAAENFLENFTGAKAPQHV